MLLLTNLQNVYVSIFCMLKIDVWRPPGLRVVMCIEEPVVGELQ